MSEQVPFIDRAGVEQVRRELRIEPHHLRRVRTQLFKKFVPTEVALGEIPEVQREAFAERVDFHPLALEQRLDSQIDGATKLVFKTRGGRRIESVLLRADTGRTTLCISSQVGCAAACDFCATGKMGLLANLTPSEIVDQVVQAGQIVRDEGRQIRNVVLMGMGEPFHNERAVHDTLDTLTAGELFNHPASRILISTVGIPAAMLRCAERFPAVNLALSLHAVRQEAREEIIPLARKYSIDELRSTILKLNAIQPSTVMVEYLMLDGLNDSPSDAEALVQFVEGLRVHVNLIPFNAIEGAPHLRGSERETRYRFANYLKGAGVTTTIRYSMGADIMAACGQLVKKMDRERRNAPS